MKQIYPKTAIRPFKETLHGRRVVDNYRWLETASEERTAWIDQQNRLVDSLFLDDPRRCIFSKRFDQLINYERATSPAVSLSRVFYTKTMRNDKHASMYMRDWPDGQERMLIDMNKLDDQENISLGPYSPTRDGKILAYGLSKNGSDWTHLYTIDSVTYEVTDEIPRIAYSWIVWLNDNSGFFYCRSEHTDPEKLTKTDMKIFFHKVGEDWREDEMIFGDALLESDIPNVVQISKDGHHMIIWVEHGITRNELFYADLSKSELKIESITANHEGMFYPKIQDRVFYVMTNHTTPRYRLCSFNLDGEIPHISRWKTIIREEEHILSGFSVIGGKLFLKYSIDVIQHTTIHTLDGRKTGELEYPGIGSGYLPYGEDEVDAVFVSYSSFYEPSVTYHYDIQRNKLSVFLENNLSVHTDNYITEQLFYRSTDGTNVPMFVIRKKDILLEGLNPTILTAYGGFEYSFTPSFSPSILFWLEQGGIYAVANIRGGGEYGENWHRDGILRKKQNGFDDFISAGEALIGERLVRLSNEDNFAFRKYSNPQCLGIIGESNGGLLACAALVQRPDLWSAVVSSVPLLDMLRFHLTEGGKFWITEYGDPENPDDFTWLLEYSPYHNIRNDLNYTSTLLIASLHDDRGTDAMHAFKMAAKLQTVNATDNPILLRTLTNVGHSRGRTTQMSINEQTEKFLFIAKHLM